MHIEIGKFQWCEAVSLFSFKQDLTFEPICFFGTHFLTPSDETELCVQIELWLLGSSIHAQFHENPFDIRNFQPYMAEWHQCAPFMLFRITNVRLSIVRNVIGNRSRFVLFTSIQNVFSRNWIFYFMNAEQLLDYVRNTNVDGWCWTGALLNWNEQSLMIEKWRHWKAIGLFFIQKLICDFLNLILCNWRRWMDLCTKIQSFPRFWFT